MEGRDRRKGNKYEKFHYEKKFLIPFQDKIQNLCTGSGKSQTHQHFTWVFKATLVLER